MKWMFNDCESLTSLNLNNFNTSSVTNMESMFAICESLTSLDLCSFSFNKKPNCSNMFRSVGYKSTNQPISIYVTADGTTYFEEETTYIDSDYATLVVKGN